MKKTNKKDNTTEETTEDQTPAPNYTKSALTVFKDESKGKWVLGRIKFDPTSQCVQNEIETLFEDLSREEINQRFKMTAAKEIING